MSAIEQRARELLTVEYIAQGRSEPSIGQPSFDVHIAALRAIVAALTPSGGFVLVPVEPTEEMLEVGYSWMMGRIVMRSLYDELLAARPEVP